MTRSQRHLREIQGYDSSGTAGGSQVARPVNTIAPVITGTSTQGQTLTASQGSWTNSPFSYAYQWKADGVNIGSASTYFLTASEIGKSITVTVTATNAGGSTSVTSAGVGPVAAIPFALTQLPPGSYLNYDSRALVTADGSNKVSSWLESTSTYAFTAASTAQPTLVANGWSTGVPWLNFNGISSGNYLTGNEPLIDANWAFLVAHRANADLEATATNKAFYKTGRLTDSLRVMVYGQRALTDTTQDRLYMLGPGGGSSPSNRDGFSKDSKALVTVRADGFSNTMRVNGVVSAAAPTGASTETITYLFGDTTAVTARFKGDLARYLRVNANLLPGKGEQVANLWIVEGLLVWEYGLQGLLDAGHAYKSRTPYAADYSGFNRLISLWGNSLTNGTAGQMGNAAAYNATARGLTVENNGVSGDTTDAINTRFQASTANTRAKVTYIGDMNRNGGTLNATTLRDSIVAGVETAQGYSAGNGHIVMGGEWIGFISGFSEYGQSGRAGLDLQNAAIRAAYPNYYLDVYNGLVALGAPTGPYPDSVAYAKGWIPDVLRQGYPGALDTLHLNTTGYLEKAKLIAARIRSKVWDL